MAIKKSVGKKTSAKENNSRKSVSSSGSDSGVKGRPWYRKLILWACIFLVIALVGGIGFLIWQIPNGLMFKNPRMRLYRIVVNTEKSGNNSYWFEHRDELRDKCGVRIGQSMFSIDVGKVRQRLLKNSSLEDVSVQISLPDTIILSLKERTPRAVIGGDTFIDENGVCFKRAESSFAKMTLPVISGKVNKSDNQKNEPSIRKALELIMVVNREYSRDIDVKEVVIDGDNQLLVNVFHKRAARNIQVRFPVDREFLRLFNELNNLVLNYPDVDAFDMRFEGKVYYRDANK